jgi:molybdopterin-guanine dinucleotide biosynthesis protein A
MSQNSCLGVVLAGGLSSRMGTDKAQLMRNDTAMVNFSKQLLTDAGLNKVIVSGKGYDIDDSLINAGPLGGIFSVLQQTKARALLILPVDLPLMQAQALKTLMLTGQLKQSACFYQQHYLPLYLPVTGFLELFLKKAFCAFPSNGANDSKGPSMRALITAIPHTKLQPSSPKLLLNANTSQQWQQAKAIFSQGKH